MIVIKLVEIYKKDKNLILIPIIAIITFATWFFNINEVVNIGIYLTLLIGLVIIKVDGVTLLMFALFSVLAQNRAAFLEFIDNIYFKIFDSKITLLNSYYIYLQLIILFSVGAILLTRFIKSKVKPSGKLLIPMVIISIYSLITLLWADSLTDGLSEFSFFIQGYLAYFLIKNENDDPVDFYKFAWFLTLLLLVLSMQYLVVYIKFPGPNKAPLSNLWANPNIVAATFGITFIPSLYKYFAKNKSNKRFLYLPIEIFIIYTIVKTQSTGLHYAFLIGLLFIPVMFIKNRKVLFSIIIMVILAFVAFLFIIVKLEEAFPEIYSWLNVFTTNRIDIYKEAFSEISNPIILIFGNGLGYDRTALAESNVHFFHSWVLQILVNRGLIGIILISIMLYYILTILYESDNNFRYFLAVGFIIYLAHGITDSGFEYQHIGIHAYFMLALLERDTIARNIAVNNNLELT